jgi:hypothetical protein
MFGLTAFAQSPFADFEHDITSYGNYLYAGLDANILNNRSITALNGVYNYTGNNASLLKAFKVYAINGEYNYVGFTSRRKIFIGNWEIGEDFVDVWTCQGDNTSVQWENDFLQAITWINVNVAIVYWASSVSVWTKQTPPTATWN